MAWKIFMKRDKKEMLVTNCNYSTQQDEVQINLQQPPTCSALDIYRRDGYKVRVVDQKTTQN